MLMDNCGDYMVSVSFNIFNCSNLGGNEIVIIIIDNLGNIIVEIINVSVVDIIVFIVEI